MNKYNDIDRRRCDYPLKPSDQVITASPDSTCKFTFLLALSLLLLFGALSEYSVGAQADNPGVFTLKGFVHQIDEGRIKRKIRVPSFENVEAPVGTGVRNLDRGILGRNIFAGTGEAGNLQQIYMRETVVHTEIVPVLFLRETKEKGRTRALSTKKGSFRFENIPSGEYELTIAVPGYTPVIKNLVLAPTEADANNEFEFIYSFESSDPEETRLLKAHYNPKSISDKATSDYNRGLKAINEAQLDEGLIHLAIAAEREEYFTEALERMGIIYFSRDDMEEAEKYFRLALKADPYSYRSLSNLGTILLNKGEDAEAAEYHELAVKVRPQDPQARYHLAMSFFQLGDLEKAADQLAKEKALDPFHFTQPQLLCAEIYRVLENFDSMILELEDFLVHFPEDPKADQARQVLSDARKMRAE